MPDIIKIRIIVREIFFLIYTVRILRFFQKKNIKIVTTKPKKGPIEPVKYSAEIKIVENSVFSAKLNFGPNQIISNPSPKKIAFSMGLELNPEYLPGIAVF